MTQRSIGQDRVSAIAILAGSVMMLVTMALHPTGGSLRHDAVELMAKSSLGFWIHILAIVATVVQAYGFVGLVARCGMSDPFIRAGLVSMVVGWIAVIGAAMASGIIAPALVQLYAGVDVSERPGLHVLWDFNGIMNHSLATIFIISSMIGTFCWSWFMTGCDQNWKYIGWIGFTVAVLGITSMLSGFLKIDVLHFGIFVFGYAFWTIAVGFELLREPESNIN